MHFIENEQLVGMLVAILLDVADHCDMARPFQIDVDGAAFLRNLSCQRRLANLTGAGQHYRRVPVQEAEEGSM